MSMLTIGNIKIGARVSVPVQWDRERKRMVLDIESPNYHETTVITSAFALNGVAVVLVAEIGSPIPLEYLNTCKP